MNEPTNKSYGAPGGKPEDAAHLEADLLPLVGALDRLAGVERAAGGGELEDRLMQTTLAALHGVQPTAAQVAELGAMDRAAAAQDLEQEVFEATAPVLQEAAGAATVLRHIGGNERGARRHARFGRRVWWTGTYARVAAMLVLGTGAIIAVQMGVKTGGVTKPPSPPGVTSGEWDRFFAAVESSTPANTDSTSGDDFDPDKLADWLSEGAAS